MREWKVEGSKQVKVNIGRYPKGNASRRINVAIERFDTWGLDHTLALIILPALIQLKNTKHGIPSEFIERVGGDTDSNYCFDFIKEDENEVFDALCDKWDEIFDKMIWSFQQIAIDEDYDSKYHHGKMDIGWQQTKEQIPNPVTGQMEYMYEMVDKNPDQHWYDHVGHTEHDRRIQEGLDLFGKYYRSLWD